MQITLKNPFARKKVEPTAGPGQCSLIARLSPVQGTLVEFRRQGPVREADPPLTSDWSGPQMRLATLIAPGGCLHLSVEQVDEQGAMALMLRYETDAAPCACVHLEALAVTQSTWEEVWAHAAVAQTLESMRGGCKSPTAKPCATGRKTIGIAALVLVLLAGLAAVGGFSQNQNSPVPASAATPSALVQEPQASDLLNSNERQVLANIVAESGVALDPSVKGKPFVVFSDPNCPSCRQLEQQLHALDKDMFTPIIVPVAFKPGALEKAASIYCVKTAEVANAWAAAIKSEPDAPATYCEAGRVQAEKNNAAFAALRFGSTPTIVAPNGRVIAGSGTTEQILRWLQDNS